MIINNRSSSYFIVSYIFFFTLCLSPFTISQATNNNNSTNNNNISSNQNASAINSARNSSNSGVFNLNSTSNTTHAAADSNQNTLANSTTLDNNLKTQEESDQDYLNRMLNLHITAPTGVLGALFIASGTPMAFWGSRNRWSSYFLTASYISAVIIMIPILRFGVIEQDHRPTKVIQGLFVIACVIPSVLAGATGVIFWKGTRFLIGACGGFVLSVFILSLKSNVLIEAVGFRWIFIILSTAAGFILTTIPSLIMMTSLFSTAIVGSAALVLGIDCFTCGGLKEFWLFILGFSALFDSRLKSNFPLTVAMQAELGVMAGVFLMGSAVQWRLLEIIKKKISHLKQLDRERDLEEQAAAYRQSMALDADLAKWEKNHGNKMDSDDDRGDSPTILGSHILSSGSPKQFKDPPRSDELNHRGSQLSLMPHFADAAAKASSSPYNHPSVTTYQSVAKSSADHLPAVDTGLQLSGSLGFGAENNLKGEDPEASLESKLQTLEQVRKIRASVEKLRSELPNSRREEATNLLSASHSRESSSFSYAGTNMKNPGHSPTKTNAANGTVMGNLNSAVVKIDYEKFDNDRRVSRPPGAPKTWTSSSNTPQLLNKELSTKITNLNSGNISTNPVTQTSSRPVSFSHQAKSPSGDENGSGRSTAPGINRYSRRPINVGRSSSDQLLEHSYMADDNVRGIRRDGRYNPSSAQQVRQENSYKDNSPPQQRRESSYGYSNQQLRKDSAQSDPNDDKRRESNYYSHQRRESRLDESDSRRRSKAFIDLNEPTDRMGRPPPAVNKRPSYNMLPNSNYQEGSFPSGVPNMNQQNGRNRMSQVMSIDQLDQRHRNAMRKIQGPVEGNRH